MRQLFKCNIYHESTNAKQQKFIYKSAFSLDLGKKYLMIIQQTSQE